MAWDRLQALVDKLGPEQVRAIGDRFGHNFGVPTKRNIEALSAAYEYPGWTLAELFALFKDALRQVPPLGRGGLRVHITEGDDEDDEPPALRIWREHHETEDEVIAKVISLRDQLAAEIAAKEEQERALFAKLKEKYEPETSR